VPWRYPGSRGTDTSVVPDLVFSEMKFLQKQHQEQPELLSHPPTKKKLKKDHAQTKEGEISAFFTSVRPALAETNANTTVKHSRPDHDAVVESQQRGRAHSSVNDAGVPTIKTANKASYLGFGSRSPWHDSNSYVSWSESIRGPSTTPARPHIEPAVSYHQPVLNSRRQYETNPDRDSAPFKRPAPPSPNKQNTEGTTEHFRVSSLAPSHNRVSRSQSHPHTSSPRRLNLVDRSAKFQSTDTAGSPSSMPPFVPTHARAKVHHAQPASSSKGVRSRTTPILGLNALPDDQQHDSSSGYMEADDVLATSSGLGKVLQQCNDSFQERRQAATPRRRYTEQIDPSHSTYTRRRQDRTNTHPTTQRVSTVRFAEPPYQEPMLPNFVGPSIYEQQAQRQQLPLQHPFQEDIDQDSYSLEQQYLEENEGPRFKGWDWEEMAGEPMSYGLVENGGTYVAGNAFPADELVQDPRPENNVVAPGFWRPNKLY
jgi:hypothetical protein